MNTDVFLNRPGHYRISALLVSKHDDPFIVLTMSESDYSINLYLAPGQAHEITRALGIELDKVIENEIMAATTTLPECSTCGVEMVPRRWYCNVDNRIDWAHRSKDGSYWTCANNPRNRTVVVANLNGSVHAEDFAAEHPSLVLK